MTTRFRTLLSRKRFPLRFVDYLPILVFELGSFFILMEFYYLKTGFTIGIWILLALILVVNVFLLLQLYQRILFKKISTGQGADDNINLVMQVLNKNHFALYKTPKVENIFYLEIPVKKGAVREIEEIYIICEDGDIFVNSRLKNTIVFINYHSRFISFFEEKITDLLNFNKSSIKENISIGGIDSTQWLPNNKV